MSNKYGIRQGEEISVLLYRDREFLGACVITATLLDQCSVRLHYYDDDLLVVFIEAFATALGAAKFEVDKPRLRQMVAERLLELNKESEDGEGSNPPTPSTASSAIEPF